MRQARIGDYWCYDLGDVDLRGVLSSLSRHVIGTVAINTSFDSGRFPPDGQSLPEGWKSVWNSDTQGRTDGFALLPSVTQADLNTWPVSHDDYCDEWYFLTAEPKSFTAEAFCNHMMSIVDWRVLKEAEILDLELTLNRTQPRIVLGNNDTTYVVSRNRLEHLSSPT